jgi:hypothetical protein
MPDSAMAGLNGSGGEPNLLFVLGLPAFEHVVLLLLRHGELSYYRSVRQLNVCCNSSLTSRQHTVILRSERAFTSLKCGVGVSPPLFAPSVTISLVSAWCPHVVPHHFWAALPVSITNYISP